MAWGARPALVLGILLFILAADVSACGLRPEPPGAFFLWDGTDAEPVKIVVDEPSSGGDCSISTQFAYNKDWFVWKEYDESGYWLESWSADSDESKIINFDAPWDFSIEGDTLYIHGGTGAPFAPFTAYSLLDDTSTRLDIFVENLDTRIRMDGRFAIMTEPPGGNATYPDGRTITVIDLPTGTRTDHDIPSLAHVSDDDRYDKLRIIHASPEWVTLQAWSGWWRADDQAPDAYFAYHMATDELVGLHVPEGSPNDSHSTIAGDDFYYEARWYTEPKGQYQSHSEVRGLDLRTGEYRVLGAANTQFTGVVVEDTMVFGMASESGLTANSYQWTPVDDINHQTPTNLLLTPFALALASVVARRTRRE